MVVHSHNPIIPVTQRLRQKEREFTASLGKVIETTTSKTKTQTKGLGTIPLLGLYSKDCDTGYSRGTCTPVFIAALFTIAKLWNQPRCPSTDEWIKKMWYNGILCSHEEERNVIICW
jgi:hypothetical protein